MTVFMPQQDSLYCNSVCGKGLASKVSSSCCEGVSGTSPVARSLQAEGLAPVELSVPYFLLAEVNTGEEGVAASLWESDNTIGKSSSSQRRAVLV